MSYTKQTWVTGDIITADKLNHMEDGIAQIKPDLILYISSSGTEGVLPLYKDYTEQTAWTYEELFPLIVDVDETEELKLKVNVILMSDSGELIFPNTMQVDAEAVLFSVIRNLQGTIRQLTYGVVADYTPK